MRGLRIKLMANEDEGALESTLDRRSLLKVMGAAGMLPIAGNGRIVHEVAAPGQDAAAKPEHSIRFSVIGVDHNHINGIAAAVIRGGGHVVSFCAAAANWCPSTARFRPASRLFNGAFQTPRQPKVKTRF